VHRWVDHTSELQLEIEAASEEDVFAEALEAFRELLGEEPSGAADRRDVHVVSADRTTLLADWLAELVFLSEVEAFLPERVADLELDDGSLRATVEGRAASPRFLVKAVTYHRLALTEDDGVWRARVVLDV
jgi:SHS2 domain-containing protein